MSDIATHRLGQHEKTMQSRRATSNVKVVFGAMTFGAEGKEQSRVHDLADCAKILDVFQAHGHDEIDTARFYGGGTSEEYLGKLDYRKRGLVMDTKYYPTVGRGMGKEQSHSPSDIRRNFEDSLAALKVDKVDMWYLHGPDRTTPYEDTLREVNNLHKEGKFDRFGISNYMSWEVAQICGICERNNWIKPSICQGLYNSISRAVEPELFPCLRAHNMGFYAYNPLGGGFFTGAFDKGSKVEAGSRFDPQKWQGKMYRQRYWNDRYFQALDHVKPLAEKHKLSMAEVALRWMTHHSQLTKEYGDAILIGASSVNHIEQNLLDLEKGSLPDDVIAALDEAWDMVKPQALKYWH